MRHDQALRPEDRITDDIASSLRSTGHSKIITGAGARDRLLGAIRMNRYEGHGTQDGRALL